MSRNPLRWLSVAAVAAASISQLAGCGSAGPAPAGGANAKIAFLMPDIASTRYELFDKPLFEAKIKSLCGGCSVIYSNEIGRAHV